MMEMNAPDYGVIWLGICGIMGVLCYATGYSAAKLSKPRAPKPRRFESAADY